MELPSYFTGVAWFSVLLLIGLICSILALKFKVPDVLLLMLAGLAVGTSYDFSHYDFLAGLAVFFLVMIIFESTSKFKVTEVLKASPRALKLASIFLVFCIIFLTLFTHLLFSKDLLSGTSFLLSAVFAALMSGTSAEAVLTMLKGRREKIIEILKFESILNTPLAVLIPIIILSFHNGSMNTGSLTLQFLQNIMAGVGAGLVLGIFIFELMKKRYIPQISPLAAVASALFAFVVAEKIGGSGVLSVTTLGLLFGAYQIKEKLEIEKFINIFTAFLKIVVFILLGVIISIPANAIIILKSLLLFAIYILIRFSAVHFSFKELKKREKWFMALSASKGIAVAVVAFTLVSYNIPGLKEITDLAILFIFYSIITSSITMKFANRFLKKKKRTQQTSKNSKTLKTS